MSKTFADLMNVTEEVTIHRPYEGLWIICSKINVKINVKYVNVNVKYVVKYVKYVVKKTIIDPMRVYEL